MYVQRTCGKGGVATLCTRLTLVNPQKANCSERWQMFMITGGGDEAFRVAVLEAVQLINIPVLGLISSLLLALVGPQVL